MKIVIDIGHGGKDSGATYEGIKEKDVVLEVGKEIKKLLSSYNCDVILTRENDSYITLNDRVILSNNYKSDVFVSLHCNSFIEASACGVETYCYNIKTNNNLANTIHQSILKNKNLYQKNRGVKENSFYVLKNTNCKACLVEMGFLSNAKDREKLLNYKKEFAEAITEGIVNYLSLNKKQNKLYRVCVGSFSIKENAEKLKNELQEKGYTPFIYTVD